MAQTSNSRHSHVVANKLSVLFILLIMDLGMNCSFDFDSYQLNGKDLIAVPLVIQLVIQISIFLILFLSMAGTYLFRVGLLGILIKKFRSVLLLQALYVTLTLITGAYRIYLLGVNYDLVKLWEHDEFVAVSLIHKCGLFLLHRLLVCSDSPHHSSLFDLLYSNLSSNTTIGLKNLF
jgi:hypothetical protein